MGSAPGLRRPALRWLLLGVALAAFVAAAAACDGGAAVPPAPSPNLGEPDARVDVGMRDIAFELGTIEVEAATVVEFRIENRGNLVHDFTIDGIPAELQVVQSGGRIGSTRSDVHVFVDRGRSAVVRLRVEAAGEYPFYCSVAGHRQAGMEGVLVVR